MTGQWLQMKNACCAAINNHYHLVAVGCEEYVFYSFIHLNLELVAMFVCIISTKIIAMHVH